MLLSHDGQPPLTHPSVATIGFFDGVHLGHRYLIRQVQVAARQRGLASMVVSFPVHPRRVMQASFQPHLLLSCAEKVENLALTGLDQCLMVDFTPQLAMLTAREFMTLLRDRYSVRALVIGHDHRFGHNRAEGLADYVRHGHQLGMEVIAALPLATSQAQLADDPLCAHPQRTVGLQAQPHATAEGPSDPTQDALGPHLPAPGPTVSSSLIRRLLEAGDVSTAASYLGYNYFLQGDVVSGHHIGRTLGYPTANLQVDCPDRVIPADGVYAVRVSLAGQTYGGMMNIGLRPTADNGTDRSLEVHVFGLHADLYRHAMRVNFVTRLRPERRFDSLHQLAAQLQDDERRAKQALMMVD